MTKQQKRIVFEWLATFVLFTVAFDYNQEILDNWQTLQWPLLLLIMAAFAFLPKSKQELSQQGRENLNEIVNNYFIVKLYMVIYSLACALFCLYAISNNIKVELDPPSLALALLGIILPAALIHQLQRYRAAGDESESK